MTDITSVADDRDMQSPKRRFYSVSIDDITSLLTIETRSLKRRLFRID